MIPALFLLLPNLAHAEVFQIKRLKHLDRPYYYRMMQVSRNHDLYLDCSSFFQNLSIFEGTTQKIYYLSESRCHEVADFFLQPTLRSKCLLTESSDFSFQYCESIE